MFKFQKISENISEIIIDNPKTKKKKLRWINIINAGKKEIELLRKEYSFELEHLQASSSKTKAPRPNISKKDNYIFMILHFPAFIEGRIIPSEIDFFIGEGYLITLHNNEIPEFNNFFNFCKKEGDSILAYKIESSAILLYELLDRLLVSSHSLLDQNSKEIEEVEDMIFENEQKKSVSRILILKRNIINFRKITQNYRDILEKLMYSETKLMPKEKLKPYYIRLIDTSKKIWQIIDSQKDLVDALHETNDSMLNFQISTIMKTLTIFSVIVFPLTLLAAIFGMNTLNSMPFINDPYGFFKIIIIMLLGCLGMLMIFAKKKWL